MSQKRKDKRTKEVKASLLEANVGCLLVASLLVGLPFAGLGGFFVYIGLRSMQEQAWLNSTVVPVQATILSSRVQRRNVKTGTGTGDTASDYRPDVVFSYRYGGLPRTSDKVWPVDEGGSEAEARAVQERYPAGKQVSAFVDPDDPTTAFLEKRWSQMPYVSVLIGSFAVCFVVGLGILLTGWRHFQLALGVGTLTAALAFAAGGLAVGHYLGVMPDDQRHGAMVLAFGVSVTMALIPLAAVLKARQLRRLYLEALRERVGADAGHA